MIMTLPGRSQGVSRPQRLWSVGPFGVDTSPSVASPGRKKKKLSGPSAALLQTSRTFAATRSVVFAGDRVVLMVDLGLRPEEDSTTPVDVTELISLDAKSGAVKNKRDFTDFGQPTLFATNDAHVILSGTKILRLTPDLKDDGGFDPRSNGRRHSRVQNISPDGSTLGESTRPGYDLVNATTLQPTRLTEAAVSDSSVSTRGVLTDRLAWAGAPNSDVLVTYIDAAGEHHLSQSKCGGNPAFLTDNLLLETGCDDARVLDLDGKLVRSLKEPYPSSFAGVSQDGKRFALQLVRPGEILTSRSERFSIYSLDTFNRIASLRPPTEPMQQSWSAFSPDGSLFVVGSPAKLTLYRLP